MDLEERLRARENRLQDVERDLKNYQSIEEAQTKTIRQLEERLANADREVQVVLNCTVLCKVYGAAGRSTATPSC